MALISWISRNFVQSRMLDAETGFNFWLPQIAAGSPYDGSVQVFTLVQGTNLYIGPATPGLLDNTSIDSSWPWACVYSNKTSNTSIVTPSEFAGPVMTTVDFYIADISDDYPADMETPGDLIEDAMLETFNRVDYYGDPQAYANKYGVMGFTYNNEMTCTRGPVQPISEDWAQRISFQIVHRIFTNGH